MAKATPSARPVWSGSISFGLVSIPVRLFIAVREKTLHFRTLHDQDKMPLKQKMVCSADGKEVHREHMIKGYEIEKDNFVIVRQEELEAVAPKSSKAIEIQDFVALDDIDPIYFDRTYYVLPKPEGAKPYRLLMEAMAKTKRIGIAKIVMHNKEYLAALRPIESEDGDGEPILCLETMHFADEVVGASAMSEQADLKAKVDPREMKAAEQLIESLTTDFKPEKYHDEYRERVMELIEKKAEGEQVVVRSEAEPAPTRGRDLIAALEASLAANRKRSKTSSSNGNGHHKSTAATARRRRSA
jgi:DNA end-binding protein Ku